jgi:CRISPR-associated protein Csb2
MFALGIRYLNSFVAAAEPSDRNRAEWPPHPGRVFMALAAVHFQTGEVDDERRALLWMESLPKAPEIWAPEDIHRAVVTQYVPVNDKSGPSKSILQSAPITRDRQPRTFARAWLEDDTAFVFWPDQTPGQTERIALEGLCAKVSRIGHSSSLVQMWVAESGQIHDANWTPDDRRATVYLRVAGPGTLNDLALRYNKRAVEQFAELSARAADDLDNGAKAARRRLKQEFSNEAPPQLRPEISTYQGYARPALANTDEVAPGSVMSPNLLIFRLKPEYGPYRQLDLQCTLALSAGLREALSIKSQDLPGQFKSIVSGLDDSGGRLDSPHLALLPLPFVGHDYAAGHLVGGAVALPDHLNHADRRQILATINQARHLDLKRLGKWELATEVSTNPPESLRANAWTAYPGGATDWSTVTPVVFDRHPKTSDKARYQEELAEMIADGCRRMGLPQPREVIVTSVSAHRGAPPSYDFPRLVRKDGSKRRHTHAILIFGQKVCGPILVGAGRYRGYGFFRPLLNAQRQKVGS